MRMCNEMGAVILIIIAAVAAAAAAVVVFLAVVRVNVNPCENGVVRRQSAIFIFQADT